MAVSLPHAAPAEPPGVMTFLGKAVAFAALTLVPLLALEALSTAWSADHIARKYAEVYAGTTDWPVIAIGSSHAVHGVVPAVLAARGLRAYNHAYNGSGPVFQAAWLDAYLATGKKPRWLVWCVDWFSLGPDLGRRLEHDAAYLPAPTFFGLLADRGFSRSLLLANRSAFWREREHLQGAVLGRRDPEGLHYVMARYDQGYVPLETERFSTYDRGALPTQIVPDARAAMDAVFDRARALGIRVVMVEPPEYTPLAHRHPADEAVLAAIATAHGAPMLNYNGDRSSSLNTERADFVDWGHLSERGAARWSATLAQDLATLGAGR